MTVLVFKRELEPTQRKSYNRFASVEMEAFMSLSYNLNISPWDDCLAFQMLHTLGRVAPDGFTLSFQGDPVVHS